MGGLGGLSNFFGSEILAKSDFFGSMKDAGINRGISLGCEKRTTGFFGVCQKSSDFLGRQIMKL